MKKILLCLIMTSAVICGHAQGISVSSFLLDNSDMTAKNAETAEMDQNGDQAALIKVESVLTGFTFDGGALGIVKTIQEPDKIWVFIPRGAKKITIKHPQLGMLRDYYFPCPIEAAKTYKMRIVEGYLKTIVNEDAGGQYFVLNVNPPTAKIYIDDVEDSLSNGYISIFLPYGSHDYRISAPLYRTEAGKINIEKTTIEKKVDLEPAFGHLRISTTPLNTANVYLDDGEYPIGITPFATDKISEGRHKLRIEKEDYETSTIFVEVPSDGTTKTLSIPLVPYSQASIKLPKGCQLFVDGENKGFGNGLYIWEGKLSEGIHHIEARKDSHRPSVMDIDVKRNSSVNLKLKDPIPIYGSLSLSANISNTAVLLDGKVISTIPTTLEKVLIGNHSLTVIKKGLPPYVQNILIEENKNTDYRLDIKEDSIYPPYLYFNINGIKIKMIRVEGGYFRMGATKEQNNPYNNELPVHYVKLSPYYIGETEVTQELWKAVMGSYKKEVLQSVKGLPSLEKFWEGSQLPVEYVSWNDCQEFTRRLNKMTMGYFNFSLPTEAEWEYAARGGNNSKCYQFSGSNTLSDVMGQSSVNTFEVKSKQPNELGIYDMTGNVWEWCQDWYADYTSTPQIDPTGPSSGTEHVFRGGGSNCPEEYCRITIRGSDKPEIGGIFVGFRLVAHIK